MKGTKLLGDMLLAVAMQSHHNHPGAFEGNNFVECPSCLFHVHVNEDGESLTRHWGQEYDRTPITDLADDRLK